jgi:phosphoglycolate phosphatase/putative hydrolase of the HAD superfamily
MLAGRAPASFDAARLKAIVFDVDGTLYRQKPLQRAMLLRLARHALTRPWAALPTFRMLQAYRHAQEHLRGEEIEGALAEAQLRLACERSGQPEQVVAQVVARWMDNEPLRLLDALVAPALRALLAEARRRGLRLGVFSDYPAAAKLSAMRLSEYFDVVVSAQDPAVNRFKPHPSGLHEALRRLDVEARHALYVGDRHDVDARVAEAAGVPCVIVGRAGSEPRPSLLTVADYVELHALLFAQLAAVEPVPSPVGSTP